MKVDLKLPTDFLKVKWEFVPQDLSSNATRLFIGQDVAIREFDIDNEAKQDILWMMLLPMVVHG
jgi:hypothetical protein